MTMSGLNIGESHISITVPAGIVNLGYTVIIRAWLGKAGVGCWVISHTKIGYQVIIPLTLYTHSIGYPEVFLNMSYLRL